MIHTPNPNLPALFHEIVTSGVELRLLNLYQGIPIAYPAALVAIAPETICIRTEKYQFVCLYLERETYLQCILFPGIIKARVIALDLPKLQVFLADLELVDNQIGARTQVRVQPKGAIPGQVRPKTSINACSGELADLSQDGLAVYLPQKNYISRLFPKGAAIAVSFYLPGEYDLHESSVNDHQLGQTDPLSRFDRSNLRRSRVTGQDSPESSPRGVAAHTGHLLNPRVEVTGALANAQEEPAFERVRIGLRLLSADPSRAVISKFIARRQSEIMREIRELSDLLS